ncbi:hypothetical protein U9M48_013706 [Paspalum notatum var. saurae]|uniref:peptidylprolyl isomerase n=1 Tax=Paspalum notatum var. saurae TaxID=547442 RepID=A0AAQ3T2E2_PASNO
MAFWGVEVKPGKPYTHTYQANHGRLRICQATLGNCDAAARTVLQCNVGNKIPIKLCSLNPKLAEMCHLEIELEEVDDVVFSHLCSILDHEVILTVTRESYGEDIGQSETDEEHDANEDSYESDFIDDCDVPEPEKYRSSIIDDSDDEYSPHHHKPKASDTHKAGRRRRLKSYQVGSTDDDNDDSPVVKPAFKRNVPSIFDITNDEEDGVPISIALDKKDIAKAAEETNPQNGQANNETRKKDSDAKKRKCSATNEDPASPMDMTDANAPSVSKQSSRIKKKSKKKMRNQSGEKEKKQSNMRTLEDGKLLSLMLVKSLTSSSLVLEKLSTDGMLAFVFFYVLVGMHVGEKRRLIVPPSMRSDGKSVVEVPKDSSVIYEIELVKVK